MNDGRGVYTIPGGEKTDDLSRNGRVEGIRSFCKDSERKLLKSRNLEALNV